MTPLDKLRQSVNEAAPQIKDPWSETPPFVIPPAVKQGKAIFGIALGSKNGGAVFLGDPITYASAYLQMGHLMDFDSFEECQKFCTEEMAPFQGKLVFMEGDNSLYEFGGPDKTGAIVWDGLKDDYKRWGDEWHGLGKKAFTVERIKYPTWDAIKKVIG